ncbi:MAG: DUF2254 domain-containing protein [Proteobacteria bacterium]|nr:MAG: DUF2254 domain-containing protein [Pseudomonadota bacterium]
MRFSQVMPKQIVIHSRHIKNSYWFIPTLMALFAVVFATISLMIDFSDSATWLPNWAYLFSGGSDGARDVVGVIAGSIITVAGVTFSISIVILSLASQQYGSRLLRNFTRDRALHFIIGAFIATYVFCLLVLPSIHAANDAGRVEFIPRISVSICVAAAIADVFVLIFFIHHVSKAIQAAFLSSSTQKELMETLNTLYPAHENDSSLGNETFIFEEGSPTIPVIARRSGYFQSVDIAQLVKLADQRNSTYRILVSPGDYVVEGDMLIDFLSQNARLDEPLTEIEKCFALGYQRTMDQDPGFGFDMLVEMAVRALSPGINDPFTAIQCIDHLREPLRLLAIRGRTDGYFRGKGKQIRIIIPALNFQQALERSAPILEFYARQSPTVLASLKNMLLKLEKNASMGGDRISLKKQLHSIDLSLAQLERLS